jgi:hypothetical protein
MATPLVLPFIPALGTNAVLQSGAKLYTYEPGTTTPKSVYTNAALTVPHTNPVVADSDGRFDAIFLDPAEIYRLVLKTSADVTIDETDDFTTQDNALRTDLSDAGGAARVGRSGGGTVADGIFLAGRAAAIAGSKMQIDRLIDSAAFPLEDQASIWSGKLVTRIGLNGTFTSADGQAGSPSQTLFVRAVNNGSPGDVVGATLLSSAAANDTTVFGANILAIGTGKNNCRFVGLEVDVEPTLADTSPAAGSAGIYINVFNKVLNGAFLQTGGVSGGTFANGIILGGLATTGAGLALQSGNNADSLINTTVGTFTTNAIILGNDKARGIRLTGTGAVHGFIYNDTSNNIRLVAGAAGGFAFRNNSDTTSLASIGDSGSGGFVDLAGAGGEYRINGTKVVAARGAAVSAPAGGATIDAEARTAIGTIISRLQAHGLIA